MSDMWQNSIVKGSSFFFPDSVVVMLVSVVNLQQTDGGCALPTPDSSPFRMQQSDSLSHSLILIMGILGSLDAAKSQVGCPTWK